MNENETHAAKDFKFTAQQIATLERGLLSLRQSSNAPQEAIDAIAAVQFQEILRLRTQLDAAMGFAEEPCDLVVSLHGPGIGLGVGPSRNITGFLSSLHVATRTLADYLMAKALPDMGRPPRYLASSSEFQFMGVAAGSVRLRLNLTAPRTLFAEMDRKPVEDALSLILYAIRWIGSNESADDLRGTVNDDRLTRLLLHQVRRMTPRLNGQVNRVEFAGRMASPPARYVLSHRAANRIRDAVAHVESLPQSVTVTGRLRTADLDSGAFMLRERPDDEPSLRCQIPREIMTQAITFMVEDVEVGVRGTLTENRSGVPSSLRVDDIYEVGNEPP